MAKRKLEIANTPHMQKLAKEWAAHNDLYGTRPMIHFEMGTVGDKGFKYECLCTSGDARNIEWQLGESMQNYVMVGDDRVVTPDFYVGYGSWFKLFDMNPDCTRTEGVGFHINLVIKSLDSLDGIKSSAMGFDEESFKRSSGYYGDILGDRYSRDEGRNGLDRHLSDKQPCASYDNGEHVHGNVRQSRQFPRAYGQTYKRLPEICD